MLSLPEIFAGLDRAYGIYQIEDKNAKGKKKGRADTKQQPVTAELWDRHISGDIQLGIVPIRDDATCVFGAIDIDVYDLDHNALEEKIKRAKFPLVMVRSKSGGAHLYAFVKTPITAERMREVLCDWAASLGYGGVEIFPKQNKLFSASDTGNWINMPYCGGDASDRHGIKDGKKLTMKQFLEHVESSFIPPRKMNAAQTEEPELLYEGPPCLSILATSGIPEGTRNTTAFNLGIYCKRRNPDDWEERLKILNQSFISPPLDSAELQQIIAHLGRKEYIYTCKDKPLSGVCQRRACIKKEFGIGPADAQEYFGIGIENVIRLETQKPIYFADMNDKRVVFEATDLNSQAKFRELMINQVNEPFRLMSAIRWNNFIIALCAKAEIVEAPQETKMNAETAGWLEEYCTEQIPAKEWSDVIDGMVFESEGNMYFRPNKFVNYISKEHRTKITVEEAYKKLQGSGVSSVEIEIDAKKYRLWVIPSMKKPKRRAKGDM